jgi:hypothetical protein
MQHADETAFQPFFQMESGSIQDVWRNEERRDLEPMRSDYSFHELKIWDNSGSPDIWSSEGVLTPLGPLEDGSPLEINPSLEYF